MNRQEADEILEELSKDVRPEALNPKAKRLFEAIMKIADERDKFKEKNKKALDFINDKNNYFEDGENWQNVLKIKEILEE